MEVNVKACHGVPEEAILSLRTGAVRRQAAISSKRPFRFPQLEPEGVLKFDIMQKIGSGYAVLRPLVGDGTNYKVTLGQGSSGEMMAEIEVKPFAGTVSAQEPDPDAQGTSGTGAKDAKQYLESTGILNFIQGVLQVVIKERPTDPFLFMARHFMQGYDESKVPASPAAVVAPAVEAVAEAAVEEASSPPPPIPAEVTAPPAAVEGEGQEIAAAAPEEKSAPPAPDAPRRRTQP